MILQETINEAVDRLVRAYSPTKIYLYGNYAWGTPGDDDDLKFLIIVESSCEKVYKRSDEAYNALLSLHIPKTVAVFTEQEFNTFVQDATSTCYEISTKGKMVYARD